MLSAQQKQPLKPRLESERYYIPSTKNKADKSRRKLRQNGPNFITSEAVNKVDSAVWRSLGKISEQEKIEIIETGLKVYF